MVAVPVAGPHERVSLVLPSRGRSALPGEPNPGAHAMAAFSEAVGFAWLLRLRWGAVVGQLAMTAVARFIFELSLPYSALLILIAFTALTNLEFTLVPRQWQRSFWVPGILATDVAVLAAILFCSGGMSNPFGIFLLVHVALGALLLERPQLWALSALVVIAAMFLAFAPARAFGEGLRLSGALGKAGTAASYALAVGFVAHFVAKISAALRDRDRQLADLARVAAENERLAMLSNFAASAAHELGSPLATIAVAAKELALGLRRGRGAEVLTDDAELIETEVARCGALLRELSARAGESMGELATETTVGEVLDDVRDLIPVALRTRFHVAFGGSDLGKRHIVVERRTLAEVLRNLLRNALEAQDETGCEEPVVLRVSAATARLRFSLLDRGPGIAPAIRHRLGDPFVTTKADRGGLGLGIYLARAYAARTGGTLDFTERAGGGTRAELRVAPHAWSHA